MSTKTAGLLLFSIILVASATITIPNHADASALPALGLGLSAKMPPGKTYKSPKHIFTVVAPKPTGFDVHGWVVDYESMKGDHEMVTFYDVDFGETYRAGVAETYKSGADLDTAGTAMAA